MDANESFYKGVRPSDLRFDNVHLLAEFIQGAGVLVNESAALQADSKELLSNALVISKEGVVSLEVASEKLKVSAAEAQQAISDTINHNGGELVAVLNDAIGAIRKSGTELIRQSSQAIVAPASEMKQAAAELIEAAALSEASRAAASDARMKMIDYRRELDAYEVLVQKRCKESVSRAMVGLSFWGRLAAAFVPPIATLSIPKAPARTTSKTSK